MNRAPKPLRGTAPSSSSLRRSRVISSRAPNGSSNRNIVGSITNERASEARMRMPPESCLGYFVSNPASPTSSIALGDPGLAHRFRQPCPARRTARRCARTVRHWQQRGVLEDVAEVRAVDGDGAGARRARGRRRCAAASTCRIRSARRSSRTRRGATLSDVGARARVPSGNVLATPSNTSVGAVAGRLAGGDRSHRVRGAGWSSRLGLVHDHSAGDVHRLAGAVVAVARRQEQGHRRHVGRARRSARAATSRSTPPPSPACAWRHPSRSARSPGRWR